MTLDSAHAFELFLFKNSSNQRIIPFFFFYRNQNILMFCTRGRALDKELILIESVLIDQMFVLVFSIQKQIMIFSIAIDSLSLACLIHSSSKEWQALKYLVLFFDYWLHRANKTHC